VRDIAVIEYRAFADMHDRCVDALIDRCGEDDAEQIEELRAAQKFIRMARTLIESALSRSDESSSPAGEPSTPRTPEPSRESLHFPRWRA